MLRLLIIEADDTQSEIYQMALDEYFTIERVADFSAASELIPHSDIVISDWEIGAQNVACLATHFTKQQPDDLPVLIVVTTDNRESSMIQAYNNGASFYITRPYKVIQFTESVLAVKNQIETVAQIRRDREQTALSTKTAIGQCTLYGMGMDLASALVLSRDMPAMAKKMLSTLRLNGIHAAVELRDTQNRILLDSDEKECDETLAETFSVLKHQGTCYRFGRRCMLTEGDMSLLLKHVVHSEDDLYETTIDVCRKLLVIAHAHYCQWRHREALQDTQAQIINLITANETETRARGLEDLTGMLDTTSAPDENHEIRGARLLDLERF